MSLKDKLIIPTREGYEFIEFDDILYCKAAGNRCEIQTSSRVIFVSRPLKSIEDKLPESHFFRIHQSYLVNIDKIVKYIKGTGGYIVVNNGHELKVAETRKKEVLQKMNIL